MHAQEMDLDLDLDLDGYGSTPQVVPGKDELGMGWFEISEYSSNPGSKSKHLLEPKSQYQQQSYKICIRFRLAVSEVFTRDDDEILTSLNYPWDRCDPVWRSGIVLDRTSRGPGFNSPTGPDFFTLSFQCVFVSQCFIINFKGARSYFSKFSFLFYLKNHHSKDANFKFQLKRSSRLDVRSNFVYCSCLYLTV